MRTENIYDAISGLDEKYVTASDNSDAIRLSFRKNRAPKIKMIGTVCACTVVVMVSGWIGSQGWFGKKPPVESNTFVPQESTFVSDDQTNGQTQERQTTVGERSTTGPAKETESRAPKTEKQTQATRTDDRNRQEPTTKAARTDVNSTTKPPRTDVPPTTKARETSTTSSEIPSDIVTQPIQHGDYAAMIKVVDTVYIDTYKQYDGEIDESRMKRSVSYTDGYPRNDGEQNFSRENVDYVMISNDTVICLINGDWIIFRYYAYDNN